MHEHHEHIDNIKAKMSLIFVQILLVGVPFSLLLDGHPVSALDCGAVNFVRPAILGGSNTLQGEWPFLAAIQKRSGYICGGTIISYRHIILTAAHCIQRKNSEIELLHHEVVVRLGAFNLTLTNEKGVVQKNVSEVFVHPDWDAFEKNFDADIAILVLSDNITFTDNIQPVCMPGKSIAENMEGTVVGYGVRKSTVYAEIPRRISVKAVNSSHCFREDDVIRFYSSERTFCGGNGDGSPDLGDSGSGYFFTPGVSWAQYGIVSVIRTNDTGHVFPNAYHVYTNLTMFKDWIKETVHQTGGEVGESKISITMTCDYEFTVPTGSADPVYVCKLYNIDIPGNNFESSSFNKLRLNGKTQKDVKEIHFANGTMSYLPSGFGLFFENIEHVVVGDIRDSLSLGTKVIRRSDLRNLRNVERLSFLKNDIQTLHEDAFWDLPNLQKVVFFQNKLKEIGNEMFSKNQMVRYVNFYSNQISSLPTTLFQNNPMLEWMNFRNNSVNAIDKNFFKSKARLMEVLFGSNQFNALPKTLFQDNLILQIVDFERNNLSSIDESLFRTNAKLRVADFGHNRIESLPRNLFRNNLELFVAKFPNNSLMTIDEKFFETNRRLVEVDLSSNRFETLPGRLFENNLHLGKVNFEHNILSSIDEKLFHTNVNLVVVNFASNRIESLPRQLFQNNVHLSVVSFQQNLIRTIDENLFLKNGKLNEVSFAHNELERLERNLFRNTSLTKVDLSSNRLTNIDVHFAEFDDVRFVDLNRNPCVNGTYVQGMCSFVNGVGYQNLEEFQNLVFASCSNATAVES